MSSNDGELDNIVGVDAMVHLLIVAPYSWRRSNRRALGQSEFIYDSMQQYATIKTKFRCDVAGISIRDVACSGHVSASLCSLSRTVLCSKVPKPVEDASLKITLYSFLLFTKPAVFFLIWQHSRHSQCSLYTSPPPVKQEASLQFGSTR